MRAITISLLMLLALSLGRLPALDMDVSLGHTIFNGSWRIRDLAVSGDYAYVSHSQGGVGRGINYWRSGGPGLMVFDISNPSSPRQ